MVFTSLAVLLAGLSINCTVKNGNNVVFTETKNVAQYCTRLTRGDNAEDEYIEVDSLPFTYYSYDTTQYYTEISFVYTYEEGGNTITSTFLRYVLHGNYDQDNDVLTDADFGLFGYLGKNNLYVENAVLTYSDNSNVLHHYCPKTMFNYLYYDNLDVQYLSGSVEAYQSDISFVIRAMDTNIYQRIQDSYDGSYNNGFVDGSEEGYNNGYKVGNDEGYYKGKDVGYQIGFLYAKSLYENQDSTINSIFSGILSIGLIPVEFLMSIFNFEVLGINFAHIVSAILTIMVTIILLRVILGGKNGDK